METEKVEEPKGNTGFAILIVVIMIILSIVIGMEYIGGDKYFRYEKVDNLVGLCGFKIGDSREKVDAYLLKKMNTKPKEYSQRQVYLFEQHQLLCKDKKVSGNFRMRNYYSMDRLLYELEKEGDSEIQEVNDIKKGDINGGKIVNINSKDNGWNTTDGLNLVIYDVYGFKIKDYELIELKLIFYNNKLLQIEVEQNFLGNKLFRAKYGEFDKIRNGNIVAKNLADSYYSELKIFDKELLEECKKDYEEKLEINKVRENKKLLKEYNEY